MPTTATLVGALLGLGTQMYSNALRKLPYMRHPWEHLLGMGLGAILGNQLVKWDDKLKEDLDKMLEKAKAANERRYFVGAFDGINWDFVRETLSPYSYYLGLYLKDSKGLQLVDSNGFYFSPKTRKKTNLSCSGSSVGLAFFEGSSTFYDPTIHFPEAVSLA
ncbi:hypothetical protein HPP92_026455 [Vanilla planifolia]|uniref:Uncharacterized protein n=1 Tax=Vanilla planifolia TaxID=51239 RepID=A0A835PG78_VANPL|nr:hypothetical protein HPP92_026455 [Vanilla planifolia]